MHFEVNGTDSHFSGAIPIYHLSIWQHILLSLNIWDLVFKHSLCPRLKVIQTSIFY